MVKFKILISIFIFVLSFRSIALCVPIKKEIIGNTEIETGTSTEDIMPFLIEIEKEFGSNFEYIYGQYRGGYIIIKLSSNGKITNLEEMQKIADIIGSRAIKFYRSDEGWLRIFGKDTPWDAITIEFKNGLIASKELQPTQEEINKKIRLINSEPVIKLGITIEQRKQIYKELRAISDRAYKEAEETYPDEFGKSLRYEKQLREEYEKDLCNKYNITEQQASKIDSEGYFKHWSLD